MVLGFGQHPCAGRCLLDVKSPSQEQDTQGKLLGDSGTGFTGLYDIIAITSI